MNLIFETSPLPVALLLLWFAVPGIWLGATALAETLAADRVVGRILCPAIALAAWIGAVQIASMVAHSFWIGLPTGMIALSVLGLAVWWQRRRIAAAKPLGSQPESRFSRGMWLGMAIATTPIAVMAWNGHFFDELLPVGHMSIIAQLENDYFPPHVLGFPHVLLRYHYGFDLVCAGLAALTRIRVDTAIRTATVFGWAYCWCLLWVLGERLTGAKRGGFWTAFATLMGGGAAAFFIPFLGSTDWGSRLIGEYTCGAGTHVNPPIVSYIFQHPFSLGLPLSAALLLMAWEPSVNRTAVQDWSRHIGIAIVLAALSITQSILFLALAATLAFTEIVTARRWRFGVALTAAFVAAWIMGGTLFTRIPNAPPLGLHLRFWPTAVSPDHVGEPLWLTVARVAAWHVVTFGFLLPLGIWGLWHAGRLRTALLLLALGGLLVPLCVSYDYSWDIVKFSAVAAFALGILSGTALTGLSARRTTAGRAATVACTIALVATSATYVMTVLGVQLVTRSIPRFIAGPVVLGADDRLAVEWLRTHVHPNELVYRLPDVALGYIQEGGLPSLFGNFNRHPSSFGIWPEQAERSEKLLAIRPSEPEAYRSLGISWFVVGPDDPRMERNALKWLQGGEVAKKADFGSLRIYTVVESDPRTAAHDASPTAH